MLHMSRKVARKRKSDGLEDAEEIQTSLQRNWFLNFKIKKPFHFNELHKAFYDSIKREETNMVFVDGPAGTAKAQPLDAKILTPTGYINMGDIKVGDSVFTQNGELTTVTGVFPQGKKQIFKVIFSDDTSTECCDDHLWLTQTYNDRVFKTKVDGVRVKQPRLGSVKTLHDIRHTLNVGNSNNVNHSIPICEPIKFNEVKHIIHPYILGVLLGDGCLLQSVSFCTADIEILAKVRELLPSNHSVIPDKSNNISFRIVGEGKKNIILDELRRLRVFGCNSLTKFIPDEYLYDSVDNRVWLMRGLMDTDGCVLTRGDVIYSSISLDLIEGLRFIVESLGGTCGSNRSRTPWYTYTGAKKAGQLCYNLSINCPITPVYLERKRCRLKKRSKYFPIRYIKEVQEVGFKEAQCIMVDSDSHLYLTNNCIVTHNTYISILAALELYKEQKIKTIIYIRSVVESASRSIGALPGEVDNKFSPYAAPLLEKVKEITDETTFNLLNTNHVLQAIPVNFVRGLTFNDAIVIVDEFQNLDLAEATTILTRFGRNTKYILCGDSFQADIGNKTCINKLIRAFDNNESVDNNILCFRFGESEIVRSKILRFIVKALEKIHQH